MGNNKPYYKFIYLIINSTTPYSDIYQSHRERWIKSFDKYINALYFFINLDSNLTEDYIIENNNLTIKGNESCIPGILEKTLKGIQIVDNLYNYDFIIRTNLSSCWQSYNLEKLLYNCDVNKIYAKLGYHNNIKFPSGAGIIIPKNIVNIIINNINDFEYNLLDDVEIGSFLTKHNIKIQNIERYDFIYNIKYDNNEIITFLQNNKHNIYHYRILYDRNIQDTYINSVIVDYIF